MLVAISQRNDANKHGDRIDNLENNYVEYFLKFGIKLLVIPNVGDVSYYFDNFPIEGVILSGGNDINTGEEGLAVAPLRDEVETKMLDVAVSKKLPVLCICRGMQFLNVCFGGKIVRVDDHVARDHLVVSRESAKLGEFQVNSYHGFGILKENLSIKLKSFADCGNVVEGVYHPLLPIAGIQWHPERKSPNTEINKKLMNDFVNKEGFWK